MEDLAKIAVQCYHERSLEGLKKATSKNALELILTIFIEIAKEVDDCKLPDTRCSRIEAYVQSPQRERLFLDAVLTGLRLPPDGLHVIDILEKWGVFSGHENIAIWVEALQERRNLDSHVKKAARSLLRDMSEISLSSKGKEDLRRMKSFAIDRRGTRDVDDAISYVPQKNLVLVHIADPSEYVGNDEDHAIMKDASTRLLSIYSGPEKFPMFPEEVSSQLFSLRNGKDMSRFATTFEFQISEDGDIKPSSMTVYPSIISEPVCISYKEASKIIENKSHSYFGVLNRLYSLATRRRKCRQRAGAAGQYDNRSHDTKEAKAHLLVDEMMISANTVAAYYARKQSIPVLYRGVSARREINESTGSTFRGTRYTCSMYGTGTRGRDMEKRANVKLHTWPIQHGGLGVEAYVQATCPIRKFSDLIVHFQFNSFFRKESFPFSAKQLNKLKDNIMAMERAAVRIDRRAKKYWAYHQLERDGQKLHQGILKQKADDVRARNKPPLKSKEVPLRHAKNVIKGTEWVIFLPELKIDIPVTMMSFRGKPGMEAYVKVKEVNPRTSYVRADVVKAR